MEHQRMIPGEPGYPERLIQRLNRDAPALFHQGPMEFLQRFSLGVIASDAIPGSAVAAANELLFSLREYACNYVGGWHSVMETEIFRLALDRKTDPERNRTLTIVTAAGLRFETPDEFLAIRFGREGPFTGFPEKPEFFKRHGAGQVLWLSAAEPEERSVPPESVLLRNRIVGALSQVVFVPFAAENSKTFVVARWLIETGIPTFTIATDDAANLRSLGMPGMTRQIVDPWLEGLGATRFMDGIKQKWSKPERTALPEQPPVPQNKRPKILPLSPEESEFKGIKR